MDELERLRDHMRESFSIQLEHLPAGYGLFFGGSSEERYVDIPISFIPNVDPQDVYQAVDYYVKGKYVEVVDWGGMLRDDSFKCKLTFKELLNLVHTVYEEIEGKRPKILKEMF